MHHKWLFRNAFTAYFNCQEQSIWRAAGGLADKTTNIRNRLVNGSAAQAAATDMAANGYFAHVSPDGKDPWYWLDQVGYHYSYAGENLAVNFTDSSNVETAWMNSPTHRANIEKPQYTRVGIGTASGIYEGAETTFVVQFFATPPIAPVQEVVPAKIAVATPPKITPPQGSELPVVTPVAAATTSVKVLGSETSAPAPAAPLVSPAPVEKVGWFASLLASPFRTIETIFAILFAIIAALFTIAILVRGRARFQHPSVVMGGAFLLLLISGAMLFSSTLAGPVQLNAQAASVYTAMP